MISAHSVAVETFTSMLRTLSELLEKGAAHAKAKSFDVAVLANARLAPDMFPLSKHVLIACDNAQDAVAHLAGRAPTKRDGIDETWDALAPRIRATLADLEKCSSTALDGAEDRAIEIPLGGPMHLEMNGLELIRDWSLPLFYFHVVTTYAILRHNGVDLGIRDYGSAVGRHIRQ